MVISWYETGVFEQYFYLFQSYLWHADKRKFLEAQVLALAGTFFQLTFVDTRCRQCSQRHTVTQEHDYIFGDAFFIHVLDFLGHLLHAVFDPELTVYVQKKKRKSTMLLFYIFLYTCVMYIPWNNNSLET